MTKARNYGREAQEYALAAATLGNDTPFFDILEERSPEFSSSVAMDDDARRVVVARVVRALFAAAAALLRHKGAPPDRAFDAYERAKIDALALWRMRKDRGPFVATVADAAKRMMLATEYAFGARARPGADNFLAPAMVRDADRSASEVVGGLIAALAAAGMPDAERVVRDTYADALVAARRELTPAKRKKR